MIFKKGIKQNSGGNGNDTEIESDDNGGDISEPDPSVL